MRNLITFITLSILFLFIGKSAPAVIACTQPAEPVPTTRPLSDRINNTDLLFSGIVSRKINDYGTIIEIDQIDYLKGNGPSTLIVSGFGAPGLCAPQAQVGQSYIFFIRHNDQTIPTTLRLIDFGFSTPSLLSNRLENIISIEEAMQQIETDPNTPAATIFILQTPSAPFSSANEQNNNLLLPMIILLLGSAIIMWLYWRSNK